MLGLNKSEVAKKIKFSYHEITFENQNTQHGILADRIADAVATLIEENNQKIALQLKSAGIKLE